MRKFVAHPTTSVKAFTNPWDMNDEDLEDYENSGDRYVELDSKQVPDSDGFMTDYTMYRDTVTGEYVFVFGDKDRYRPEDRTDWECDSEEEAQEWFDSYSGIDDNDRIDASTELEDIDDSNMIEWFSDSEYYVIDAGWTTDGKIIVTLNERSDIEEAAADLISCIEKNGYHVSDWNVNGSNVFIFEVLSDEEYSQLASDDTYFTPDEPLSVDGFMDMFEIMVDLSIREQAAEILYRWYTEEGEDTMPTRNDVLDMCDAATDEHERLIVLQALDELEE